MTPPERAAVAPPQVGAPQSVAQTGAATEHAAPVPQPPAGAVDARVAAPAVAPLTAGALNPESGAPVVSDDDPGWGAALSGRRAHYVPVWTKRERHNGRPTGDGLCGFPGLIDERGLQVGRGLAKCRGCFRQLEGKPRPDLGEWL